jgi:hypothetical protein
VPVWVGWLGQVERGEDSLWPLVVCEIHTGIEPQIKRRDFHLLGATIPLTLQ